MSDATTQRAEYVFRAKEYGDGTPWIYLELLREPNLPVLGDGFLGLDLQPGTSFKEAEAIASYLNERVKFVTATTFSRRAQI